jgi:hypothetical protein
VNGHVHRFLAEGAPSPLTETGEGWFAYLDAQTADIRVVGALTGWDLVAPARWHPRRVYPTPWAAAGFAQTGELVALNLARVGHTKLPDVTRRALDLQAMQFCSTPPHQWARTTVHTARYTHDGYLMVGARKIPMTKLLSTGEAIFEHEREKTFHYLSPKQRNIAQLLDTYEGLTLDDLHSKLQEIAPGKRHSKAALHVELSRMRSQPKIMICKTPDGRYTVHAKTASTTRP